MTNANCIHQFRYILVKDMLAHVFNVLCKSNSYEIDPVLGLDLGLEGQVFINITGNIMWLLSKI